MVFSCIQESLGLLLPRVTQTLQKPLEKTVTPKIVIVFYDFLLVMFIIHTSLTIIFSTSFFLPMASSGRYKKELEEYNEGMVKYLCHKYPDQKTPMSAYEVWKEKEETAIKSDRPEISQKKLNKKLKRRWENLDASEKKRYWSKSQHAIGRFQKKVLKSSD